MSAALDGACYTLKRPTFTPEHEHGGHQAQAPRVFDSIARAQVARAHDLLHRRDQLQHLVVALARAVLLALAASMCGSGGQNMHVAACISAKGFVYYENKFGAKRAPDFQEFFKRLLRVVWDERGDALSNAVFVLDNDLRRTDIESVVNGSRKFEGAAVLRPYSPKLNPIESVFSAFNARVRSYLTREYRNICNRPDGTSMRAHMSTFLERASDLFLGEAANEQQCTAFEAHALRFYRSVFLKEDMPIGQ